MLHKKGSYTCTINTHEVKLISCQVVEGWEGTIGYPASNSCKNIVLRCQKRYQVKRCNIYVYEVMLTSNIKKEVEGCNLPSGRGM